MWGKQYSHDLSHFYKVMFTCPCKARTSIRYHRIIFLQFTTLVFGVFLGLWSNRKEVKPQGERLTGFTTLLASGDSRKCTWRLLTHCCSWLITMLGQTGGRNDALGRERGSLCLGWAVFGQTLQQQPNQEEKDQAGFCMTFLNKTKPQVVACARQWCMAW